MRFTIRGDVPNLRGVDTHVVSLAVIRGGK